ncbi:MAG: DUF262 domain-containing protein [Desulfitobacteriaceae bacterium]|nr:DUF262 domain-containing protein [Desulfitobacteriaceae bacterium]
MDDIQVKGMDLIHAVDDKVKQVRTRSLDISFNELLDMYNNGELIIDPEYQRLFRWGKDKQSRFMESLIIELPIPPIFVLERTEGIYELIDGLQRVTSYLHFRGKQTNDSIPEEDKGGFRLEGCDIVKELNGYNYEELPNPLKIKLKRNFIRVEVLRKESDSRLRFYMFKRLNTGGEELSPQEIRNCIMRLLSPEFNDFIIEMSLNPDFKKCISNISDDKLEAKGDQELVLRFFTFKNYRDRYRHDVNPLMDEYMEAVSDPTLNVIFDYATEKLIFEKTFKVLALTLGEYAFARTNANNNFVASLSPYHFEAFTLGIQDYLDKIDEDNLGMVSTLKDMFIEIKNDQRFKALTTGGGKNTARELNNRISAVADKVANVL